MPNSHKNKTLRRIALVGGALYAGTRALAYTPSVRGIPPQEPIDFATLNGVLLPVYVLMWAVVAVLCLVSIPKANLRVGFSPLVGLMVAWGAIWFIGWFNDTSTTWWQTGFTYIGPAIVIGALMGLGHSTKEK